MGASGGDRIVWLESPRGAIQVEAADRARNYILDGCAEGAPLFKAIKFKEWRELWWHGCGSHVRRWRRQRTKDSYTKDDWRFWFWYWVL